MASNDRLSTVFGSSQAVASYAAPRAAYVHVPFCHHRCGYCNFTLVAGRDDLEESYLEALERELTSLGEPREVDTVFLGGGTPTHLAPSNLRRLLSIVERWFPRAEGYEMTIEANPIDLNDEKVALLAELGVTRLSLGVQSFDDVKLQTLDRDHRRAEIEAAVARSRPHFQSISLDLIFGVPGESAEVWQGDLASAIALAPDHLSTYGLTFERGTTFWTRRKKGEMTEVGEEVERWMYETAIDTLTAAGFEHYEVSNFAKPEHVCRHNEAYWIGSPYFAAGPGAARFVDGQRETNHRSTTTYIQRVKAGASPVAESEKLAPEAAARERLVFGLRKMVGVDRDEFAQQTGYTVEKLGGRALTRAVEGGLLAWSGSRLQLTRAGLMVSDAIWPGFLRA